MCGIVGYVGPRPGVEVVLDGLRRLEYRGYDSAGIAVVDDATVAVTKRAGKLANLVAALEVEPLAPGAAAVKSSVSKTIATLRSFEY